MKKRIEKRQGLKKKIFTKARDEKSTKKDLLLEIGTEEIPASFLAPAVNELQEKFSKFFQENRISFGAIRTFYTPRRLALIVSHVAEKQKDEILELQGPPKKFAYDDKGIATKVATGFASSNKVKVKDLYTKEMPKGEYVFCKKKAEVKSIEQILKDNLSSLILNLQFPKTMRWTPGKTRFARPIRWITLVYGTKPIIVQVADLKSSQYTYGHRNSRVKKAKIIDVRKYEKVLKSIGVMVKFEERKKWIKKQLDILSRKVRGKIVEDDELLNEATNICEMPKPLLCEFKPDFLNLPSTVLITALKTHTRSFAVKSQITSGSGRLLPYFIAITNTPSCNVKQVRYWYEQAVESRLDDAKFYYDEDIKIGLEKRVEDEKKVVWIEGLGTLRDKTSRLEKLSFVIAQRIPNINNHALLRAAFLCKADLLTNMVREKEYTSLQGIMGGIYAQALEEDELVGNIIAEHYLPRGSDDELPKTAEGAILSIADKIDNIVGAFIANTVPSGSYDPFGLRRQAMAIGGLCIKSRFFMKLEEIIELSFEYFGTPENPSLLKKIKSFFVERLNALLLDRNIRYDVANAVLSVSGINALDNYERAKALTELRGQENFEPLVIGQKRVNNILKGITESFVVHDAFLLEEPEKSLYAQAKSIESALIEHVKIRDYKQALELVFTLRPAIDTFFDKVLVMTSDESIKNNRLGLLQYVKSLFMKIADLSEIVIG